MKKKILQTIYSFGGFKPFHFLNRKDVLVLMYHRFSERTDPLKISREEFALHLAYLKENTNVITLDEFISSRAQGKALPENSVVLSIDDGYRDVYEIAYPLLTQYRIPATLFVITDFLGGRIWLWTDLMRYAVVNTEARSIDISIGGNDAISETLGGPDDRLLTAGRINELLKHLTDDQKKAEIAEISGSLGVDLPETPPAAYAPISWDQAREMDQNGVRIECHTVSHPILTKVDKERLQYELTESRSVLEFELGRRSDHFCYPNGCFDDSVRDAVINAGFRSAVTTNYGFCDGETGTFELKRIDGQPAIANFAQSVSGFERIRERIGI